MQLISTLKKWLSHIRIALSYIVEAYRGIIWKPAKLFFYRLVNHILSSITFKRDLFYSTWSWILITIFSFSIVAFIYSILVYTFAFSEVKWFVNFWDTRVLYVYEKIGFQHIWWLILTGLMIIVWSLIRPLSLSRIGGWKVRFWGSIFSYSLLFTLFIILAWRFQHYILGTKWFLVVGLFMLCHFLFLFSIGIISCIINRIPGLNQKYIQKTEEILRDYNDPIGHIFETSLYGYMVKQMAGSFFDRLFKKLFGHLQIYPKIRKIISQTFHILSFAWLIDRIFGGPYYVHHFEMILRNQTYHAHIEVSKNMQKVALHPALLEYANHYINNKETVIKKLAS